MTLCDSAPSCSPPEQIISVAVPRPLHGLFTYKLPPHLIPKIKLGGWVKVPFGTTTTHAFIVEPPRSLSEIPKGLSLEILKEILEVNSDDDALLTPDVLSLCQWASDYYFAPLGEVLNCAAPAIAIGIQKLKRAPKKTSLTYTSPLTSHILTQEQSTALEQLDQLRLQNKSQVGLLHGVTGSGKTEIYIELAKRTLSEGKTVLILVPEIALTPQLHQRFEEGLKTPVGLWHSALAKGKRRDQNLDIRKGEIRVVVGARSAVFAPLPNLGLIVVDEEHDPTYKQEDRVRYHARDLAIVRGKLTNSSIVLGSATPSLESQERTREGKFILTSLPHRVTSGGTPEIELVDLRVEEKIETSQAFLAKKTIETIQRTLDQGDQVIVYLNRRGYASFLICQECGNTKGCPSCSISLTVYKQKSELRCHFCGHTECIPHLCSKCQGSQLQLIGAGTESLESDLQKLIPNAKLLRLDRDQVTSATRLNGILNQFRNREANVLLGTQMLVKGHDFPGVTLVIVILADSLFKWPDFRAQERALQILKQVAGRAGRGQKPGKVLIQTFDTQHPVLQVLEGKFSEESFLESERQLREALGYPPFGRFARLRFESSSRQEAIHRSQTVALKIQAAFPDGFNTVSSSNERSLELLGPSEAFMEKIKGIFRWDLLLKAKNIQTLQLAISLSKNLCSQNKWQFWVDVDPYGM